MIVKKDLDIIIPVYNEGDLIIDTLSSISKNFNYEFNILLL